MEEFLGFLIVAGITWLAIRSTIRNFKEGFYAKDKAQSYKRNPPKFQNKEFGIKGAIIAWLAITSPIRSFKEGFYAKDKVGSYKRRPSKIQNAQNKNFEIKGELFEKFIVQKFDRRYFDILEWRGDKYVAGYYAKSSFNPDLEIQCKGNGKTKSFAVECKFRQYVFQGGVSVAKESQLTNYKNYEKAKNLKVYFAIGIGGKPDSPKEIFVLPLDEVTETFIDYEYLKQFKKSPQSQFYYDLDEEVLR